VLQSGGEEGMWTFDRYQRWMEQVTDWVRPPSPAALRAQGEMAPRAAPGLRATARAASPRAAGTAAPTPTRAAQGSPPPKQGLGRAPSGEDVIEIHAEEMDLAALAELAKKAVERKT
jgi:hypothetical protein